VLAGLLEVLDNLQRAVAAPPAGMDPTFLHGLQLIEQQFRTVLENHGVTQVAAEKVRTSGMPYVFGPMNSRERRVVHLALRDIPELRTQSEGEGSSRHLVVYPKDYKGKAPAMPASGRPMGRRR